MYMHPRSEPSREETGCFMFFAWPIFLVVGIVQLFFTVIGWLFEQVWFYALLAVGLIVLTVAIITTA